jgi:hypothetical protein
LLLQKIGRADRLISDDLLLVRHDDGSDNIVKIDSIFSSNGLDLSQVRAHLPEHRASIVIDSELRETLKTKAIRCALVEGKLVGIE